MTSKTVRTRFAPSPTGIMHIGNLRTALYAFLIARSMGGTFILRIEDTDQERQVEGAVDAIYNTLRAVGIKHDEGPDIGGPYGPYIQSERLSIYRPFAEELVSKGRAYYCFCSKERLAQLRKTTEGGGYDRHCRELAPTEVQTLLKSGVPYVIRQKMPLSGTTAFEDAVYGSITVDNQELEDQILLKSDGYPTYNFANVIDDHLMLISHVVRGSEYLSSTPKYDLLYEAFGWEIPTYVHLPLIVGKDGRKLSKRHGATSFEALVEEGYLPQAIINAIALLGWCPEENRELFTIDELCKVFSIDRISKSPSVFDYDKLAWFNAAYIRAMSRDEFLDWIRPSLMRLFNGNIPEEELLAELLQPRLIRLKDLDEMLQFLVERKPYELDLFDHKKNKTSKEQAAEILPIIYDCLSSLPDWNRSAIHEALIELADRLSLKTGQIMWPLRIALSGQAVTPGGAVEIAVILGRSEALERIRVAIERLKTETKSAQKA